MSPLNADGVVDKTTQVIDKQLRSYVFHKVARVLYMNR